MNIEAKWLDKDGNVKPNSWQADSENPNTLNAMVALLAHRSNTTLDNFNISKLNANKHLTNDGRYITNDYDIENVEAWNEKYGLGHKLANALKLSHTLKLERSPDRFSHDETNSISSTSFYFMNNRNISAEDWYRHRDNLEVLEIATSQTWYRNYDCGAGVRYSKNPDINKHLICQIQYFARKAFNSTRLDARGKYHASGKIQAWIRIVGLELDLVSCMKDMPEEGGLVEMFANFIPEEDHIINVLARRTYGV